MDTICECPICYDPITSETGKVSMACLHSFHFSCIAGWFGKQCDNNLPETCPCCRRQMSEKEALPVISEEDESDEEDEVFHDEGVDGNADANSESESESDSDSDSDSLLPDLSETEKLVSKLKNTAGSLNYKKKVIEASIKNIECIIEDGEVNPGIDEIKRRLELDELYLPANVRRDIFNSPSGSFNFSNQDLLNINQAALVHIVTQEKTFEDMLKLCENVSISMPNMLTLQVTVNVEDSQRVTQQIVPKHIVFNPEEEDDEQTA